MSDAENDASSSAEIERLRRALAAAEAERDALRAERDELEGACAGLRRQLVSSADELRQNQRLLHYIAEYAPAVIYVKNLEGRFLLSNRLHAELLGCRPADVVGRSERDFLSQEEADAVAELTTTVLVSGEGADQEFEFNLPDGTHWFLEQIFPLFSADDEPFAIAGISTDVTRRKRAEEQLAIFRALVEHSPDAVIVGGYPIDWERPLAYVNGAGVAAIGAEPEVRSWLEEQIREPRRSMLLDALERAEQWRETLTLRRGGEERHFDATAFLISSRGDHKDSLAWILRDVTVQRRLAAEQVELQQRIINAQDETLLELSAPLMPLTHGIIAMPMIGRYNQRRSDRLINVLAEGLVKHQAKAVILDITGLRGVDSELAVTLNRITRAIGLLGARLVLTGVTPAAARVFVDIEHSFRKLVTRRTLGDGIAYARTLTSLRGARER
ncbi:MAG: PAS domain-containing protein [Nannocystaceae bacterium]|nr:PAS domain-containing protein [Myxococcales bacterium]